MPVSADLQRFPFKLLPKYPHMLPADVALWERFVRLNKPHSDDTITPPWTVAYDVHVGSIPELPPDTPAYVKHDAEALYPFKIDVVIFWPSDSLVVEIKPRASLTSIGQVLGYTHLFRRHFPQYPEPKPFIITDTAHLDINWLSARLNIGLIELDHLEEQLT